MSSVEQSIDVGVDATTAYDQWARFESFPQWMEGVASVDQTGDGRLHWVAKVKDEVAEVKDETREWDARITEQVRDRRISWESVGGKPGEKPNAGSVTLEPLGDSACRVTFRMDWEPEAALADNESYLLAAVNQVVAADLAGFKEIVEARAGEPGSWRGRIAV
jgi:uncharacterized membrane protein